MQKTSGCLYCWAAALPAVILSLALLRPRSLLVTGATLRIATASATTFCLFQLSAFFQDLWIGLQLLTDMLREAWNDDGATMFVLVAHPVVSTFIWWSRWVVGMSFRQKLLPADKKFKAGQVGHLKAIVANRCVQNLGKCLILKNGTGSWPVGPRPGADRTSSPQLWRLLSSTQDMYVAQTENHPSPWTPSRRRRLWSPCGVLHVRCNARPWSECRLKTKALPPLWQCCSEQGWCAHHSMTLNPQQSIVGWGKDASSAWSQ